MLASDSTRSPIALRHGRASDALRAWMAGGWSVYIRTVSIEAMTVPYALLPSFVLRFLTYAYDAGIVRACVYYVR